MKFIQDMQKIHERFILGVDANIAIRKKDNLRYFWTLVGYLCKTNYRIKQIALRLFKQYVHQAKLVIEVYLYVATLKVSCG